MDLLIDSAAGHAMFSFMDGFSGYNQIHMSKKDAEKTAFRTPIGNFYYTVMPFGLKNADATYQRTMTAMFHDMMHQEIEDYVGDIGVKSKRREDHLETLRKVFERCRLYKLKMNPLKCDFGVSAGKFLGFLVHNRVCTLRLYLASNGEAIGALVAQEDEGGTEKPVYYVSRALRDAETRNSGAERTCLALVYASQRLRHYFLAHKIQLMTKSHLIRSLLHRPILSGKLA